jgi:hypothetical protein
MRPEREVEKQAFTIRAVLREHQAEVKFRRWFSTVSGSSSFYLTLVLSLRLASNIRKFQSCILRREDSTRCRPRCHGRYIPSGLSNGLMLESSLDG